MHADSLAWFHSHYPTLVGVNLTSLPYSPRQPVTLRKVSTYPSSSLEGACTVTRLAAWPLVSIDEVPRSFRRVKLDACALSNSVIGLGNALQELSRRTERGDTFSLNVEWWAIGWELLRRRRNGSHAQSDSSQLSVARLILVVYRRPLDVNSMTSMLTEIFIYPENYSLWRR
jgi:hypothetical protein